MNTLIQQGCIKLIKSNSKDIILLHYLILQKILFQINSILVFSVVLYVDPYTKLPFYYITVLLYIDPYSKLLVYYITVLLYVDPYSKLPFYYITVLLYIDPYSKLLFYY